ncbi:thioredoxin reductase (NADPH) [Paraburkholderia sp. BL18I3N2]|uniref:FAD-dependent oxidoreductase n=1 Tax=Paraburkholderia sp. BL18I3N2 TaxID=1938799 RepID=UPI000D05C228|nr:FAD-dependent oxidoreductase [Paraburkholderia sp. BL18I3N2]PRX24137.1 thioredoxin reductase (NADPH) [Paraburkholderia sp. BL18I3N2]
MLSIDDVQSVPLFSRLPDDQLDLLARTSADLRLRAGEFAVHEGCEGALFAVLSGKVEAVKIFDGVERNLGWRLPGSIFGELPLTLCSPFLISYRASELSRVMRVDVQHYHAIAAVAPEVASKVGALARERVGGLQEITAEPYLPRVAIVGGHLDNECAALKHFLTRNQISFECVDPDEPASQSPRVRFEDGTLLTVTSTRQLAEVLGLTTRPGRPEYDTMIIGGGPAGLAAAVYGASEGLRTLVLEREAPGGQAGTSSRIENYLGFPNGVSGDELASRALQQARRLGAEVVVTRSVIRIDAATRSVHLDGGDIVHARTIILATGVAWRRLAIKNCEKFIGKGVHYGASRAEANATHGRNVVVVGGGNSAGQAALFFSNHAKTVTLLVRGSSFEKSMSRYLIDQIAAKSNIFTRPESEVVDLRGGTTLAQIRIFDRRDGTECWCACEGLFIFIGADAETDWLPPEILRDQRGYVLTGEEVLKAGRWTEDRDPYLLESSLAGVFACGDVRLSPVKRVASAVGEGSMAIAFVHKYLQDGCV